MAELEVDEIDMRLLVLLQSDGRMANQALAERVGLSPSPCLRRLRRLEQAGVIQRYAAVIDQTAVGLPVSVFVSVKLERQVDDALEAFDSAIQGFPEVVECYLMTGNRDYLLRVVTCDLAAYERFLRDKLTRVPGVAAIESSFALKQVKNGSILPVTG